MMNDAGAQPLPYEVHIGIDTTSPYTMNQN